MSKHTPGPWIATKQGLGFVINEKCYNGFQIANTQSAEVSPDEANARLIAAAPTMLEALKECRDVLQDDQHVALESVMYAIAKAESE